MSFGLSYLIPGTVSTHRAAGDITNRAFGIGPPATIPPPPSAYKTGGVIMDDNNYLSIAALAAGADTPFLTYSLWAFVPDIGNSQDIFWCVDPHGNQDSTDACDTTTGVGAGYIVALTDNTGAVLLRGDTGAPGSFTNGAWHNILFSAQTNLGAGLKIFQLYLDDVPFNDITVDAGAGFLLTFTGLNFFVGTDTFNPPKLEYLADFWFDAGRTSLFDLSIVANRRKFIDPLGKPVDLGATGSIPTGSPPAFFLRRAPADAPALFANDRSGNGNNFTITGALVNSPSSPTD